MESGLSASDIALLGNDGGMGGNAFMWIFALLILAGGGFGNWNRTGEFGQYATAASQQEILFGQQFQGLDNKIDRLGNGIADATFSLNNAITNEGRNIQSQLATCCCENQKNVDALRYDMAQQMQSVKDMISQNKIETLQAQISQLQLQNAMCGVVRYPNQWTYNAGNSPFCNCGCTGLVTA